ncbi:putative rossmann-like alpha/beta/alpha sandwich protein [Helianthus annuus]|uniref:Rossmann-like alpha/beta/alpha sandwich protein n=1 Tax=Helianthus annuus TaxID=4232 RepID=A0A9K3IYE0_HELAN|nr:putative rossmann-like alpha/beta/alpha sandwich protein [Helianthus annuus]KAJ0745978.1 putative rossmann-like alpha/beta/alpha sandwich protein [Helianthus annuus]
MLKSGYEKKCADMLPGLKKGQDKMSKSDTSSTIFMEDEEVHDECHKMRLFQR